MKITNPIVLLKEKCEECGSRAVAIVNKMFLCRVHAKQKSHMPCGKNGHPGRPGPSKGVKRNG